MNIVMFNYLIYSRQLGVGERLLEKVRDVDAEPLEVCAELC